MTAATYYMVIVMYMRFQIHSVMVSSFGHSRFAGLCLTTLNSFVNLGQNSWLQLKLNALFGYQDAVGGGLGLGWIIGIFVLKPIINWIKKGDPETHGKEH